MRLLRKIRPKMQNLTCRVMMTIILPYTAWTRVCKSRIWLQMTQNRREENFKNISIINNFVFYGFSGSHLYKKSLVSRWNF